ncbi:MAG TPA: geranylgeranylglyceryl/heptaprenylglyceryl phosphate synthase [Candidatus Mcinerneyibacteriales bacterium]|nr:geranylgeranylglyceryl/heptaprenylglyceryl phosphate synthase [Candidatus Mcinerneyibacteriales bacterium]
MSALERRVKEARKEKRKLLWVLMDPDKQEPEKAGEFARACEKEGVDLILVGTSLMMEERFHETIRVLKASASLPVYIFPASSQQVSRDADGILFLSLVSGRNPQFLIEEHVRAAPLIRKAGLDAVPTAYLLIDSGKVTAVHYMSHTLPLPRDKEDIIAAHAMAAEMLGMKMIYLEGGSGAREAVPGALIKAVRSNVEIPVICGGGIDTPEKARLAAEAGADIIVVGTAFERDNRADHVQAFREALR